jgi:hypothetical protein
MVGSDKSIDFLVSLLVGDGLLVDPFVAHRARRSDLHRGGLTPGLWLDWMHRVVYARLLLGADGDIHPVMQWPGPGTLRSTLSELWDSYVANYSDVVADRAKLWPRPADVTTRRAIGQQLGREAIGAESSNGLPMLRIFLVRYVKPVIYMATHDVAVVGDQLGRMESREIAGVIIEAAAQQRALHGRSDSTTS